MDEFFDAGLIATTVAPIDALPAGMRGGLFAGDAAVAARTQLEQRQPRLKWRHAAVLRHLVGAADARFPRTSPASSLFDLKLDEETGAALRRPERDWFALAESAAQRRQFIRVQLPPHAAGVSPLRRLATQFPQTRFWLDAFRHGPGSDWQAHVRAAEVGNIWLSTLGLFPGECSKWPAAASIKDALHFTMGEVGASKVLFASGCPLRELAGGPPPGEWLRALQVLDERQIELVLALNSRELLD